MVRLPLPAQTAVIAGITGSGSLTIGNGGTPTTLQLAQNSGASSQNSLSILANGTLDITNNRFIIDYGSGPDPISSIEQWIKNGFYDLSGPQIISSDIAADDTASGLSYGIGYADGANGVVAGLPSGEIEIMLTLLGDVNLDATVNSEDFTLFSEHVGQSGQMWDDGGFKYDGAVIPKTSRFFRTISASPPPWPAIWNERTPSALRMCPNPQARE